MGGVATPVVISGSYFGTIKAIPGQSKLFRDNLG